MKAFICSANVFGVSTESMQLSFDSRGNSVPTILLLMQKHLYTQGGLEVSTMFLLSYYYDYYFIHLYFPCHLTISGRK